MSTLLALGIPLALGKWYYITMISLLIVLIIIYKVIKGRQT